MRCMNGLSKPTDHMGQPAQDTVQDLAVSSKEISLVLGCTQFFTPWTVLWKNTEHDRLNSTHNPIYRDRFFLTSNQ